MAVLKAKQSSNKNSAKNSDNLNRTYGTGRRKCSVARVWVKPGTGKFIVNKLDVSDYFKREALLKVASKPFTVLSQEGKFDVYSTVSGGGHSGQAGAILLGLARALDKFDPEFHKDLRRTGLLTRDSRVVERKKYGQHKARKKTQFSKR